MYIGDWDIIFILKVDWWRNETTNKEKKLGALPLAGPFVVAGQFRLLKKNGQ